MAAPASSRRTDGAASRSHGRHTNSPPGCGPSSSRSVLRPSRCAPTCMRVMRAPARTRSSRSSVTSAARKPASRTAWSGSDVAGAHVDGAAHGAAHDPRHDPAPHALVVQAALTRHDDGGARAGVVDTRRVHHGVDARRELRVGEGPQTAGQAAGCAGPGQSARIPREAGGEPVQVVGEPPDRIGCGALLRTDDRGGLLERRRDVAEHHQPCSLQATAGADGLDGAVTAVRSRSRRRRRTPCGLPREPPARGVPPCRDWWRARRPGPPERRVASRSPQRRPPRRTAVGQEGQTRRHRLAEGTGGRDLEPGAPDGVQQGLCGALPPSARG